MKMALRALLVFVLSVSAAYAQQTGVTGVVTDTQGAVIAGAKLRSSRSGGSSYFATRPTAAAPTSCPTLTAAEYTVTATAPGFCHSGEELPRCSSVSSRPSTSRCPSPARPPTVIVEASDQLRHRHHILRRRRQRHAAGGAGHPGQRPQLRRAFGPGPRHQGELLRQHARGLRSVHRTRATPRPASSRSRWTACSSRRTPSAPRFGQPHVSQDAICQFQIITNRFDATLRPLRRHLRQRRRSRPAPTRCTAAPSATSATRYFNAADPITKKKSLTTSLRDQQYGGTFGGAIRKDKLWYFGSFEGEHQPNTATLNPYVTTHRRQPLHPSRPRHQLRVPRPRRLPAQRQEPLLAARRRLQLKHRLRQPGADPSQSYSSAVSSSGYVFDWNHNFNDHLINDIHAGFHYFQFQNLPYFDTGSIVSHSCRPPPSASRTTSPRSSASTPSNIATTCSG